jgi:hypothetical protein
MASQTEPYYAINWPGGPGRLPIVCAACGRTTVLTPQWFWNLPIATAEDLESFPGLVDHLALDYTLGGVLPLEHARDFVLAGIRLSDVHALEPPPSPEP